MSEPARMKKQLTPALNALKDLKLLKRVTWTTGKYGNVVLEFQKGDCFRTASSPFQQNNDQETILSTNQQLNEELEPIYARTAAATPCLHRQRG